jgi:hypothetical protein
MTISINRNCQPDETIAATKTVVEFEVPTIGSHTFYHQKVCGPFMWSLLLIGRLHLSGTWHGLQSRMDTKKRFFLMRYFCAQNILIILGSKLVDIIGRAYVII